MSFQVEHNELRTRFSQQIGTTPVAWPNVAYVPIVGTLWVRFNVVDGESTRTTIGATTNNVRSLGLVIVQIFAPLDKGNAAALAKADAVAAIFRDWCGSTVRCRTPSIKEVGPDGNGWYQVNVSVPFQRDELL